MARPRVGGRLFPGLPAQDRLRHDRLERAPRRVRPLKSLDRALLRLARTAGHSPRAERAVAAYARLGEHGAVWLALGVVLRSRRGVRIVLRAYAINQAVKIVVRRRRPELPGLGPLAATRSQLSFPSAHATTSFAALRAYCDDAPRVPLAIAVWAMAFTRVYLGVHWPTDVAAGAVLGTVVAR